MKKAILFFLLSPLLIVAQRSHLSYANAYLIPVSQTPLSYFPQSGEIRISPSSYFKGLNYEFDLIDSTWSLKAGAIMGCENYSITNYNQYFDNNPLSPYMQLFANSAQLKSSIFSLGIQNSYYFNEGKDVISWNAGVYFNRCQQLDYLFDVNLRLVREVDFAEYYTKIIVPSLSKNPIGFDFGVNLRKTLFNRFYMELSGKYMPRNILTYTYQTYNTMNISGNGGYLQNTSGINEKVFHYGVVNVQFNVGVRF